MFTLLTDLPDFAMKPMKTGTKIGLAAFVLALVTARYWFYLASEVALPESRVWFVVAFLLAASLGVYAFVKRTSWLGAIPPIGAIVIGLFLPFTIAVSSQSVEANRVIAVGDTMPSFLAVDGSNNAFDSSSLNGHLVLIKFFRAHW